MSIYPSALLALGVVILYACWIVFYRLVLHPLARFPGPKFAAATKWYEAYFDLVKWPRATFMHELNRMHDVYGPIVRITPDEVHIKDSAFADTLFIGFSQGIRDKYPPAATMAGTPDSVHGTIPHNLHRKRRMAMNGLFLRSTIVAMEPMIRQRVNKFCENLQARILKDGATEVACDYLALTTDVVSQFALNHDTGMQSNDAEAANWHLMTKGVTFMTPFAKQFPWVIPLSLKCPLAISKALAPDLAWITIFRRDLVRQAREAIKEQASPANDAVEKSPEKGEMESANGETARRKTLWQYILTSSLPASEKEAARIAQEGFTVIVAGSETTARILTLATFHILANRETVLPRLKDELLSVMPSVNDEPDVKTLERLPWLTAVIKETLRVSGLVTSRIPLMAPQESLRYGDWMIPPGTPVSLTQRDVLHDPEVYPDPLTFTPARWLDANADLGRMNRNWIPFSRGSRVCVGINLAMVELYLTLATVFRRFDLELHDTYWERDVKVVRDYFLGEPGPQSRGVKVKFASGSAGSE